MSRRAVVVVMDACGVGALPDADEYGDAGSNTLGHLAEAVGGLRLPTLERLGLGNIIPILGVPPASDPVVHGRLRPLGPGQGVHDRALGADGRRALAAAADLSERVPARRDRGAGGGDRPALLLQPAVQRHRGDQGLRRAPPGDGGGDPLHERRFRAPDRDPRRSGFGARAVCGLRGGAAGDDRRARRGPRDRPAVRGRAGSVPPDRGQARLRVGATRPLVSAGASGRRRDGARRRQDPRPVRRRRGRRQPRRRHQRRRHRRDD